MSLSRLQVAALAGYLLSFASPHVAGAAIVGLALWVNIQLFRLAFR